MADSAGGSGKKGLRVTIPRRGMVKKMVFSSMAKKTASILRVGGKILTKLERGEVKTGEDGPARLKQDMVNLEAESSMAEYAAIEGRRVEDEPARLNQDMIHLQELEAESVDDVFLSFSGSDNLFWFAGSLYRRLVAAGITVFRDDGTLGTLSEELPLSVRSFKIYIPIFSRTYADCPRCLDALTLMVEHTSRSGGKEEILPVFYDVERSDVQLGKKSLYGDALDTHRGSLGDGKVEKWKKALVEAVKVKGWELRSYNSQAELVTSIAREISLKLKVEHNYVLEDLSTGADPMLSYRTLVSKIGMDWPVHPQFLLTRFTEKTPDEILPIV